jgi:hypothetical protein
MMLFEAIRDDDGDTEVRFHGKPIDPERSLCIRSHCASHYDWGTVSQATAQLALAMLMELLPVRAAEVLYERFAGEVLRVLPYRGWRFPADHVLAWVDQQATHHKEAKEAGAIIRELYVRDDKRSGGPASVN